MSQVPPKAKLFINGVWKDGDTFDVRHPQSLEISTVAVKASLEDCNLAVAAAQDAFPLWESTAPSERRRILMRAADLLESEKYIGRISEANTKETGALISWATLTCLIGAAAMRDAAVLATTMRGETVNSETKGLTFMVQRRALGVVLAISPWNGVVPLAVRAIAYPLICGNSVVFKSSELCPYTASLAIEAMVEAGLPKGVLNFLNISSEAVPELMAALIGHPLVRKLNFTGSDRVGKILAGEAAKHLKPCIFELGGKAACIVLADASIGDASRAIVQGAMMNSGQICMSTERVIVQRDISDSLIKEVINLASKLKVGTDESASLGPLYSASHAKDVIEMAVEAKQGGARVLLGDLVANGALVKPHILLDVDPMQRLWRRESFGPVVVLSIVDTVEEAVLLANSTEYTLTASLWTNNLNALQIARNIRASLVSINGSTFAPEISFGESGLGGATGYGRFEIEDWTEKRAIAIHPPKEPYMFVDHLV